MVDEEDARGVLAHGKSLISYGEVCYLHFEKCLQLLLKACKRDEIAITCSIR